MKRKKRIIHRRASKKRLNCFKVGMVTFAIAILINDDAPILVMVTVVIAFIFITIALTGRW